MRKTVALEMTSDMQGMMWGEPELSGLLAWDDVKVSYVYSAPTSAPTSAHVNGGFVQHNTTLCSSVPKSFCFCHCEGC